MFMAQSYVEKQFKERKKHSKWGICKCINNTLTMLCVCVCYQLLQTVADGKRKS
jgi:hypothetical protein